MRCRCPFCDKKVVQVRNLYGPNFCVHCHKLFNTPPPEKTPAWVLGVVVVLMGNLQLMA